MSIEIIDGPKEIKQPKKKEKRRVSIIVAEILFVLVLAITGVLLAINSGMFLNNRDKVLLAITNTLTENEEMRSFLNQTIAMSQKSEYTIGFLSEREGDVAFMEFANTPAGKQLHLKTALGGIFDMEITGFVDESQVKLTHSDVENVVLVYNYVEENSGYLFQRVLPKKKIKAFNESLATVYRAGQKSEENSDSISLEAIAGEYRELEFEKVETKIYEINGEDKRCEGYQTVLEKGKKITFYIEDELLAAVVMDTEEGEIEIRFLGGDYRLQNLAVYEDEESVLELQIKTFKTEDSLVGLDGEARVNWDRLEEIDDTGVLKLVRYAKADEALANKWSNIYITMSEDVELAKLKGTTLDVGNASLLEMGKKMMELLEKYLGEWL